MSYFLLLKKRKEFFGQLDIHKSKYEPILLYSRQMLRAFLLYAKFLDRYNGFNRFSEGYNKTTSSLLKKYMLLEILLRFASFNHTDRFCSNLTAMIPAWASFYNPFSSRTYSQATFTSFVLSLPRSHIWRASPYIYLHKKKKNY